jgi:polysaccharide export outer membrane protein
MVDWKRFWEGKMKSARYILPFILLGILALGVMPSWAEHFLGPGDVLNIDVLPHTEGFYGLYTVDDGGYIDTYFFGQVYVNGMTPHELSDYLRDLYKAYIIEPAVRVNLEKSVNARYVVIGEVWYPGVYVMPPKVSVVEAIAMAGGPMYSALLWDVKVIRGDMNNPQVISVNVEDILKKGDLASNITIEQGDIIYVPRTMIARVNKLLDSITPAINMIIRGNSLIDTFK